MSYTCCSVYEGLLRLQGDDDACGSSIMLVGEDNDGGPMPFLDDDSHGWHPSLSLDEAISRAREILRPEFGDTSNEHISLLLYQLRQLFPAGSSASSVTSYPLSVEALRKEVLEEEDVCGRRVLNDQETVIFHLSQFVSDNQLSESKLSSLLHLLSEIADYQGVDKSLRIWRDVRTIKKEFEKVNAKVSSAAHLQPLSPGVQPGTFTADPDDKRIVHCAFNLRDFIDERRTPITLEDGESVVVNCW